MKSLTFFLGLMFLTGCSLYSIDSEDVATEYYAPKSSTKDIVYLEQLDRPYEIIGFVTVNTERRQSQDQLIEKMKREAAILGGDAITNITSNAPESWKRIPFKRALGNAYIRSKHTATVVVFKEK